MVNEYRSTPPRLSEKHQTNHIYIIQIFIKRERPKFIDFS